MRAAGKRVPDGWAGLAVWESKTAGAHGARQGSSAAGAAVADRPLLRSAASRTLPQARSDVDTDGIDHRSSGRDGRPSPGAARSRPFGQARHDPVLTQELTRI